jgi:hypothetical protein
MLSLAIAFLTSSVVLDMSSEKEPIPSIRQNRTPSQWGIWPVVWYSQGCIVTRASSMLEWPSMRSRSSPRTSRASIMRLGGFLLLSARYSLTLWVSWRS